MKEISMASKNISFSSDIEEYIFKTVLYRQYSFEEIETEILKYGIEIHHEQCLEEYKKCYCVDDVVDDYTYRFREELRKLDEKKKLLNSDFLFFYFRKLIEENFDVTTLPDPSYIMEQIEDLEKTDEEDKADAFIGILKAIIGTAEYAQQPLDLERVFNQFETDISFVLSDLLQVEIHECPLKVKQCEEILNLVEKLADTYSENELDSLCGDALALLASVSVKKAMQKLEQLIEKYPKGQLSLCMDVLMELMEDEKNRNEMSYLEDKMRAMPVLSEEDEICMSLLDDIMEEKNSEGKGIIN